VRRLALASLLIAGLTLGCTHRGGDPMPEIANLNPDPSRYPDHWWAPVPEEEAAWWEVLPQAAAPGEVILSKRHELGLLSNFAPTPFTFHGVTYPCVEALWQSMKFPEDSNDPRALAPDLTWPFTRAEVAQMGGFEAKAAGDAATENMRAMGIDWVTFEGRRMQYWGVGRGEHFDLIVEAMRAKLAQNPEVRDVLLSIGNLTLRADHTQDPDWPPAWFYNEIWMEICAELQLGKGS
jgi:predicted NAD-dependent protein-ADP-ribosyltransferase YbiA (DUF1768 family)